jgi:putative inorganic carbon (HCO3(-)) transporter
VERLSESARAQQSSLPWWRRQVAAISGPTVAADGGYKVTTAFAAVTCAATPLYVVRWHVGPLPTTLLENAILLTIAAFVIESLYSRAIPHWRTAVTVPAIIFLVAGAISVMVPPDHRAALGLYRAYIVEPIAFGLVLINVVSTPNRALIVVGGLALPATVAGLANAFVVAEALRHHQYDVVNTPPVVIYNTANAVALFIVPLIGVVGAIALFWPERNVRIVATAFVAIAGLCVILSFSRGGYLALAAVAVGLALSHHRRWILIAAGVVGAAVLMVIPTIRHRVLTEVDLSNGHNTLVGRFHLWAAALQMLREHPVFGAGLSGFASAIAPFWNPTHTDYYTYPHNIVLNFWTETGLLGLVAFGWILVAGFVVAWRGYTTSAGAWRAIQLGVLLALVAIVVHGLVDVPYWKNDLSVEFWAILALCLTPAALSMRQRGSA